MLDFIAVATLFDIVVVLVAMGLFVAGWLQGAVRGVVSIIALVVAFVLAAGLRDPLGDFLARNWVWYDRGFNFLLALLGLWLAFAVTFQIGIQVFYRRIFLHKRWVIVDEVVGGLLGAFQVFLVLAIVTAIFASFYATLPPNSSPRDVGWARTTEGLLGDSAVVAALDDGLIPGLLAVLAPLLPPDVSAPTRAT